MSNPSYVNACLEGLLSRHMSNELSALTRDIYHMDSTLRYRVMIHFIEQLMTFRKWVESNDSKIMAARLVCAHTMDDRHDAIYQKGMFESTTLDRFLIHYLALQVHDEAYEYVSDDEKLSMPALFLISQMFHMNIDKDVSVAELFKKVDAQIEDQKRYKEITEKAKEIFDLSNPVECEIFEILKRLVKIQYLRPDVTPEEYNRMIRFQESAISKDKWDLWNKLLQIGRKNMSKEDIDAIMEVINKSKERKNN